MHTGGLVAGCRNAMTGIVGRIVDRRGVGKCHANEQPHPQQGGKARLQNLSGPCLDGGGIIGNSCLCHALFSRI